MAYQPGDLEPKWQKLWEKHNAFHVVTDYQSLDISKPKYYCLDMFPYPSASGLHVGHPLGYTATDIVSRYYRMKGYNVLHPMGFDAFGLPAEQHAIETGEHPALVTKKAISNFKLQLKRLGFSYNWEREVVTCDPQYYHWTQWIFTKLFEKGLCYQAEVLVNWCPELKTVLANEEVIDGKSERGNHPVYRVPMKQWMLKITSYAERLLQDLNKIDWPESTKDIQRHWIGKSEGAKVQFEFSSTNNKISDLSSNINLEVFTTRVDTIFGVTYLVISPEHPLLPHLVAPEQKEYVDIYCKHASQKSDLERGELAKEKSGVFTGSYVFHPITGQKIPLWVSDYVLMNYGTGVVMGVPGHDERDHQFAEKFHLPITTVVVPRDGEKFDGLVYSGNSGTLINSEFLNGKSVKDAQAEMTQWLKKQGKGEKTITYRLRDWVFSRQRYWGEPIPIMKDSEGKILRALREDELPLTLPEVTSYQPTGDAKSPLSAITSWVQRTNSQGQIEFVETDTMPGSAASSWYFLRYIDPLNPTKIADFDALKYWMPVDLYIGGQEHAVGHLLYSRFWTKFLFDIGVCPVDEPFTRLVHQGMICKDGGKMSKSKGNGVNPDDMIREYSADALRVYEMFMGPLVQTKEWDESNLAGVHRFLSRIYRHCMSENGKNLLTNDEPSHDALRVLHKTIKKVSEDIPTLSFNTSIAQMMIFLNSMAELQCKSKKVFAEFFKILSPFAPHIAEELYCRCVLEKDIHLVEKNDFVSLATWPAFDPALVIDNEITIGVQVNGKHRGEITIAKDCEEADAVKEALDNKNIAIAIEGKTIKKTIYIKNRILSFVVA